MKTRRGVKANKRSRFNNDVEYGGSSSGLRRPLKREDKGDDRSTTTSSIKSIHTKKQKSGRSSIVSTVLAVRADVGRLKPTASVCTVEEIDHTALTVRAAFIVTTLRLKFIHLVQ